jgi:hypothetical protein
MNLLFRFNNVGVDTTAKWFQRPENACRHWQSKAMVGLAWLGLLAALINPPHGTGITVCWFRSCTGLSCPGCGLTRSLSCALRGMWPESFHYHPMGLIILAVFGLVAVASLLPKRCRERLGRCMELRAVFFNSLYSVFVLTFLGFGTVRAVLEFMHVCSLNANSWVM